MSDQEAMIILAFLIGILIIVGLFFMFESKIHKMFQNVMWNRFEKRTGIDRPKDWDQPLAPTITSPVIDRK